MRSVLVALLILIPVVAKAASPEERYIAARDAAIKKLNAKPDPDARTLEQEKRARADLERQLRPIIGPLTLKGFTAQGKANLDTLISGEQGFGQLDALTYTSGKTRLFVTTLTLLKNWLQVHESWWPNLKNVPQEIDAALKSEEFYTQAISTDAAFARFADIPVVKPARASLAFAMLGMHRQDIGAGVPNVIVVAVVQESKVLLLSAPPSAKIAPIAACEKVWQESERKAQEVYAAYKASGLKDQKLFDSYTRTQEEGDLAFRKCFADRAPGAPFFAAVNRQAQDLIDRVSLP